MKGIIAGLVKLLLKTRYRIQLRSNLTGNLQSALILPNHPAEIDPVIVSAYLWKYAQPRPVVLETIFQMPALRSIFKSLNALPMPDMEHGSGFYKRKRIADTLEKIISTVHLGHNVLLYPSGRLSVNGKEPFLSFFFKIAPAIIAEIAVTVTTPPNIRCPFAFL